MSRRPASAPFQIVPGFAVPFAHAEHPRAEELNAALRKLLLEREAEGDRYRNPEPTMNIRPGLFESRFDFFDWPDTPISALKEFCWAALFKTVSELNGYGSDVMRSLEVRASSWFHVTRQGGYFGQHNHPMASWSGVYCVDPGADNSGHPESGSLVFAHPAAGATSFVDLGCASMKAPWGVRPKSYQLAAGQLVIFPSWLMHQVMPFQGEGERITVAFNAWFRQVTTGSD